MVAQDGAKRNQQIQGQTITMKFNYSIGAADFLEYFLYMVSKSAVISRKRSIAKYSFSFIYIAFGIYFAAFGQAVMGLIFLLLGICWFIFYPKLNRKSLERFYAKYTQENFASKINQTMEMTINSDSIVVNDIHSENKIPLSEFETLIETKTCFFLRQKTGNAFIIPKSQIDVIQFQAGISKLNLAVSDETNWQWK
jgi:hypothetical protein